MPEDIIPWYLRVLGAPVVVVGAVADAGRKLMNRISPTCVCKQPRILGRHESWCFRCDRRIK